MTKDEMKSEIDTFYAKYYHLFEKINVSSVQFGEWIDCFKTHEEITRAYNFIIGSAEDITISSAFKSQSLRRTVLVAQSVYKDLTADQWNRLFIINSNHKAVRELKLVLKAVRVVWVKRPRLKRKGSQ